MNKLHSLIEKHKLIRRLMLLWAIVMITWVVVVSFTSPPDISTGTATAIVAVVGVLATVLGFYQWSRARDNVEDS